MNLLAGFMVATLFGLVARVLGRSLATVQAEIARMTSPPHPAFRPTGRPRVMGIDTDPDVSPIQVLNRGCIRIIAHLLLQAIIWGGIILVLFLLPESVFPEEIPEDTLVGALFAVLLGLLVNALVWNWSVIVQLYRRMIEPPSPTLPYERPPNIHNVAAAPPLSPNQIVFGGCLEMVLRLILEIWLFAALAFLFREMLRYLVG
jgi:hypothetical protein